jgi:hypothetical protein
VLAVLDDHRAFLKRATGARRLGNKPLVQRCVRFKAFLPAVANRGASEQTRHVLLDLSLNRAECHFKDRLASLMLRFRQTLVALMWRAGA